MAKINHYKFELRSAVKRFSEMLGLLYRDIPPIGVIAL